MSERAQIIGAACAGAIVGGVCGWAYLTDSGRRFRDQLAAIDKLVDAIKQTRAAGLDAKNTFTEA